MLGRIYGPTVYVLYVSVCDLCIHICGDGDFCFVHMYMYMCRHVYVYMCMHESSHVDLSDIVCTIHWLRDSMAPLSCETHAVSQPMYCTH